MSERLAEEQLFLEVDEDGRPQAPTDLPPEQARVILERMKADRHYQRTGDPSWLIAVGMFPNNG